MLQIGFRKLFLRISCNLWMVQIGSRDCRNWPPKRNPLTAFGSVTLEFRVKYQRIWNCQKNSCSSCIAFKEDKIVREIVLSDRLLNYYQEEGGGRNWQGLIWLIGRFNAVMHFAGLKAVGESVVMPLHYYNNNIIGMINLLDAMTRHGCKEVLRAWVLPKLFLLVTLL